jgi:Rod binding domain-containing protein
MTAAGYRIFTGMIHDPPKYTQLERSPMVHAAQPTTTPSASSASSAKNLALHKAARALEAGFLAEMLKAAGLGKTGSEFGGGAGEDQFASLLVDEQARQMVEAGGIGLAETLFESLKEKTDAGS